MFPTYFLFATGIENSYPTIAGGKRIDEMEKCRHYDMWRRDFDLVQEMGIQYLRYGPPIHRTFLAPGKYDWSFTDATFGELKRRNITPIADLCHFGVPNWLENFQNPDFPRYLAQYAEAFARRYPWVQLFTPVNEMYICARFSAGIGWWNERLTGDRSFVAALKHLVQANVLAMQAILDVRADAIFVQSESSEYFHAAGPKAIPQAETLNSQRFLSLDLNYGRAVDSGTYEYLMDNGMTRDEYQFFLTHRMKQHCILGNDYYVTNEHRVEEDGTVKPSGEVFGYDAITRQYYQRYGLPVMHTETNYRQGEKGDEAVYWLWKEWANVMLIRDEGVPVVGFTWYSLTDQVDWDSALCDDAGHVNALGLYNLDRNIRPVGTAYKQLIESWRELLPTRSICLTVPVRPPSEQTGSPSPPRPIPPEQRQEQSG